MSVNSGPTDTMNLNMVDRTRHFMATGLGMVITMAADTSRNAQIRPEMWPPVSSKRKKENEMRTSKLKQTAHM